MAGHTALLVVHGIGAQEPGEALDKLARGLRRIDPDSVPPETRDGMVAAVGGHPVRLYEVYWADLLMGDVTCGTFLMEELQSLAWFPWFNIRRGNYPSGRYSCARLAWWCVLLPIVDFLVLFAYYGAAFLAQALKIGEAWDDTPPLSTGADGRREKPRDKGKLSRVAGAFARHGTTPTAVDRVLDEYVGDVLSYVNSAGKAFYRERGEPAAGPQVERAYSRIVQRFYDQLVKADVDGCASIQVVAHSLGTVVTYHALSGFGFEPDRAGAEAIRAARAKVGRLYTLGCPLEKIRFFWPRIAPVRTAAGDMTLRWDNFVSLFDPVSGVLKSFDDWGKVSNHRLLGGGFLRGHIVYERSTVFLSALAEGLCRHPVPFERRLAPRLWDLLLLIGETMLAPTVVAFVLAVGASLFALVAMLVPILVSLGVRWFVPAETWGPFVNGASLVILGAMTLAFLAGPAIRAGKAHSLYWVETGTDAGAASGGRGSDPPTARVDQHRP